MINMKKRKMSTPTKRGQSFFSVYIFGAISCIWFEYCARIHLFAHTYVMGYDCAHGFYILHYSVVSAYFLLLICLSIITWAVWLCLVLTIFWKNKIVWCKVTKERDKTNKLKCTNHFTPDNYNEATTYRAPNEWYNQLQAQLNQLH